MDLYKITIPQQTIEVSVEVKDILVDIFRENGIKHTIAKLFLNDGEGHLLKDLTLSVRATNVLKVALWRRGYSFEDTTIEQLIHHFSKLDFLKERNCGRSTVNEINDLAESFGLEWK